MRDAAGCRMYVDDYFFIWHRPGNRV